jgi:hypothetical protein
MGSNGRGVRNFLENRIVDGSHTRRGRLQGGTYGYS